MSSSALANRYSATMGDALGGAFHVTYVENLPNIVRCGLLQCVGVMLCFIETYNPTYYFYILTYNPK